MAIFKVTAKPDFTELKNAISGLESTPIKIDIDTTPVIAKIKATSQNLSKMTQTFDGGGQLTGAVQQYNSKLGETVQVTRRLNKETGELEVTQEKVTQNYEKVAKAAERAAQVQAKAQEAAQKAQDAEANRAAAEAQKIQNVLGSMGTNIGTFSGNAAEAKEWIASLDGMSGATVKATGNVRNAAGVFQTYSAAVDGAKGTTDNFTFAINESTGEVYKLSNGAVDAAKKSSLLGDSLGRVLLKMAAWQVFGDLISKVIGSFRDALNTLKDVDTEMVNVQKVTDYSSAQMQALEENAYALASAYGRTADEITAMYTAFARAGYLGDQLDSMTELGTLLANIGDISQDTASKFLLAVDAAWKLNGSESELMTVMDGLNEITNKNAVDMEALTSGITVAGSVFAEAGESVQTFSALVGAGVAATQRSGSEISRGLRTIVMNIRQIKGETEDGELIDGESIAKAANALREYAGISTMANGQLRESSAVLSDLAGKWDTLDTVAQSAIAEALAGKRQANILTALMGNWDTVEKMMQDYADGAGSALRENEIYLDSWEAKSKQLTASWTEFVSHLVETDTIKGALDGVIGLVELLDTDFGRAVVTAGAASAALVGVVTAIKAIKKAAAAFSLASLNPWVLGIMAVGAAIGVVLEATKSARKSIADFDAEIENANEQLQSNKNRLNEINAIPWNERTSDIIKEKQALESENKELERQIELLEKEELAKAEKNTGDNFSIVTDRHFEADPTIGSVEMTTKEKGTDAYKWAIDELGRYNGLLEENIELNDTQITKYNETILQIAEQIDYLKLLKDRGVMLTAQEQALIDAYEEHARKAEIVADAGQTLIESYTALEEAGYITEERYKKLISLYPELASQAVQTSKGYVIQKDALMALMNAEQRQQAKITMLVNGLIAEARQSGATGKALYDLVAAQIAASNQGLNFSQQIAALQELGYQAGLTAEQVRAATGSVGNSTQDVRNRERTIRALMETEGLTRAQAEARVYASMQHALWTGISQNGGWGGSSYAPSGGGGGGSKQNALSNAQKKAAQATIDAIRKQMKAETDAIDKQIDAIREKNKEEERSKKLEELKLDILKKQDALLNARNERTVRQYNAATGQWEWVANPEKVKQTQEDLENAKKELREYEADVEQDIAIAELEARKKAIEAAYQLKIDGWQKLIDQLNGDVETEKALLAASLGDWDTYYQEMLKVYQGLLDAAEDYQKKLAAIQRQGGGKDDSSEKPSIGAAAVGAVSGAAKPPSNTKPSIGTAVVGAVSGAARPPIGKKQTTATKPSGMGGGSRFNTNVIQKYDSGGILKGMGGIKATEQDEMILPPDITARMTRLSRTGDVQQLFRSMRSVLFGGGIPYGQSVAGTSSTDRHDVTTNNYTVNGVPISPRMAKMPVEEIIAELTGAAHQMRPFSNG